jgi:hypothetical protein
LLHQLYRRREVLLGFKASSADEFVRAQSYSHSIG